MQGRATFGQRTPRVGVPSVPAGMQSRLGGGSTGALRGGHAAQSDVTTSDMTDFIGPNLHKYANPLRQMIEKNDGFKSLVVSWSWTAFFFTFFWLLYRKMWTWAAGYVVGLSVLNYVLGPMSNNVNLPIAVMMGCLGKSIYLNHAASKIRDIRTVTPSSVEASIEIARTGGTSKLAVWLSLGFMVLFVVAVAVVAVAARKSAGV
jgi:hypothetical protein